MNELSNEHSPGEDSWLLAERTADLIRYARLHPSPRQDFANRWLAPVAILVAVAATTFTVAALFVPSLRHGFAPDLASAGLLAGELLGVLWAVLSGRLALGAASIRATLPEAARRHIGRQIIGRQPLDAEHSDIVVEAAHQERRRTEGFIAVFVFYLPLGLQGAVNSASREPWVLIAGVVGIVLMGVAAAVGLRQHALMSRFLAHAPSDAAPFSGTGGPGGVD